MRDGGPFILMITNPNQEKNLPLEEPWPDNDDGWSGGVSQGGVGLDIICTIVSKASLLAASPAMIACMSSGCSVIVFDMVSLNFCFHFFNT